MEEQELIVREVQINWARIDRHSYLRRIPALAELDRLAFTSPVTYFVGENGSGKSTLLEAIAVSCGLNPEGGTRNYNFATYDSHSPLHEALRVVRGTRRERWGFFLRAESFYNFATVEEELAKAASKEYHQKSHGESFLALMQDQFVPEGLYLLDEPEAALSPQRQLSLLAEIHRCVGEGSQFFIATHSPILLGLPGATILSFDQGALHPCAYEETDSYRLTAMFLNHRQQLLRRLLEEE